MASTARGAPDAADPAIELAKLQARFDAIVSNTPGLVYQFVLHADASVAFPYLSKGCKALLGISPTSLRQHPDSFLALILEPDRQSYRDAMAASAAGLSAWNWEGRIWIEAWKDVKWINLRASPRALASPAGSVQWEGIMTNISASRREQLAARASRARLAELAAHSERVKEQERTRIAREIHDDLGGNLTAIKMALALLAKRLPPKQTALAEKAAYVDALVDRSIDAVHRIALDLRPPVLDLGIVAALEWQVREFSRQMGIACSFRASAGETRLGQDQATALFRIAQEALTNVAKHAGATAVTVRLRRLRHHLSLKIADNGGGIAALDRAKPHSFGIRGMNERAKALGGTLQVDAAPEGGTEVTIRIRLDLPQKID